MRRVLALLTVLFVATLCLAQTESATLSGRVTDPSGAAIAGAEVVLTNTATNVAQKTKTNHLGLYVFEGVQPGNYNVAAGAVGFKTLVKQHLVLHVQDEIAENFLLPVGSISESVTVSASGSNINTSDATVSTVVDRNFVKNMPLNGRSFQTLIDLTPGVVVTQSSIYSPGQFSVNGQRTDANYFTVDGVSANAGANPSEGLGQQGAGAAPAMGATGGTNSMVSVDDMEEFRVQTSTFAPEYGRTPGAQVSIVTRSGTNQFHGDLFDYVRNSALDANDWFNGFTNNPPLPKAQDQQNDFGGVIGGPIIRNRAFFFFSYEGLRLNQPTAAETEVPDLASRQAAPAALAPFLNAFPVPNGAELGNGIAQFNSSYTTQNTLDAYSFRVDDLLTSNTTMFARWNYSPSSVVGRSQTELSTVQTTPFRTQGLTVGFTTNVSPRINNEFRANYTNSYAGSVLTLDSFGGAQPVSTSGIFPSGVSPSTGFFNLYIGSLPSGGNLRAGTNGANEQRQVNLVDNLAVTAGAHQLKFGVDYRWLAPFYKPPSYVQDPLFLGVTGPDSVVSGNPFEVFLASQQENAFVIKNFSLYAQDTWKATPRLTLTYGFRWDVNPAMSGKNAASVPYAINGLSDPATMTLAPRGTPLYNTTWGNVAPRLGVAYQLRRSANWETVLRGGVGTFYDLGTGSLGNLAYSFPFAHDVFLFGQSWPLPPQGAAPPSLPPTDPSQQQMSVADRNLKLPRTYEWNVALEQSLGSNQSLSITYVGSGGRDLLRQNSLYGPNPNFRLVYVLNNSAASDYDALQVKFRRRLTHGLQALASYTYSHSIDNLSNDFNPYVTPTNPNVDRGNSSFDIRHSFTAAVSYDIPSVGGNGFERALLDHWGIDDFFLARTSPPLNILGGETIIDGNFVYARPDVVPGQPLYLYGTQCGAAYNIPSCPGGRGLNPAAFVAPPAGQQGNLGRNSLRGFAGAWQDDFAIRRDFRLSEKYSLQFRSEFFNVLNHPNFGQPGTFTSSYFNSMIGNPLFGRPTQTLADSLGSGGAGGGLSPLYQVGGPRSIQLALKLTF